MSSNSNSIQIPMCAASVSDSTQFPVATVDSLTISAFQPLPEGVHSSVNIDLLAKLLANHPRQDLVAYVLEGFRNGFDIGYRGEFFVTQPKNLLSAQQNQLSVSTAISKEVTRGHTAGPFLHPPLRPLHCSPLGAVPKKDGTFRIILDLSSPRGRSVNEGISAELFSVHYSSFDDAVDMVKALGPSAFMAKLDIRHAFRLCPVRPEQWNLLGYHWQGQFYVDTRLPFGSRSSPYIFNTFADLLLWILLVVGRIPHALHYLDDFFLCGSSRSECKQSMDIMQYLFSILGVPIADDKTVGPSRILTFLGIEIDIPSASIRLPPEKYEELVALLQCWCDKKKCTKRQLLSLIGSLSFAAKVVKPGRMFLRRLIDLSTTVDRLHHHIDLNSEARADIQWWLEFLPQWNGVSMFQSDIVTSVSLSLFTDASFQGFGAVYGKHWFSVPWPSSFGSHDINIRELFAIVAAVLTWGDRWHNKQILFFTDNMTITQVWKSGTCRDPHIMRLVRFLFLFAARRNINILLQHIQGHNNVLADALSRLQVGRFRRLHRDHHPVASPVPDELWTILT